MTKDIYLTLLTEFGDEESILTNCSKKIGEAKSFALTNRVLLLQTDNGMGIDISLGAFPFEEDLTQCADYQKYLPNVSLKICTAEDLLV